MTALKFKGKVFHSVDMERLTPGEVDAVERVVGMTFTKINRLGSRCVCEHYAPVHQHKDESGKGLDPSDSSCTTEDCDCPAFEGDVPTVLSTALTWVAIKRVEPTIKFSEVNDTPYDELELVEDEGEPDPTVPPLEAA